MSEKRMDAHQRSPSTEIEQNLDSVAPPPAPPIKPSDLEDRVSRTSDSRIEPKSPADLHPNPRNARIHSKKQIKQIAASIERFGFNNPVLIDAENRVIAGHGRLAAAKSLGLKQVPTICLSHMNAAEQRAYVIADNKIAQNAGWDMDLLALELGELADLAVEFDLDIELTGFETGELDVLWSNMEEPDASRQSEDELPPASDVVISKPGDLWQLGRHRVTCGDARDAEAIDNLFEDAIADLVLTDPPYNVKIQGHVGGRGKTRHAEFAFASGEMTEAEFGTFLRESLKGMLGQLRDGALLYVFMDWRHIELLLATARELGTELNNICVWNKTTPGQGSFYRSAHELVAVFVKPGAQHLNNIQLGRFGRNRSNIWTFPGVNTFRTGQGSELALHPTVKPVTMIAEAIKDASKRGEIVFDPFLGSGTTLLAAEQTGRRCFGIEYAPGYVDTVLRRWQKATGQDAVLLSRSGEGLKDVGRSFDELVMLATANAEAEQ